MLRPLKRSAVFVLLSLQLAACNQNGGIFPDNRPLEISSEAWEAMMRNHKQSPLKATGKATDWAIDGLGFFEVKDPKTQKVYFTRNGAFQRDANGTLVTAEGYTLEPNMTLSDPETPFFLSEGGTVWEKDPRNGQWVQLGVITLSIFTEPSHLKAPARPDGLYEAVSMGGRSQGGAGQNYFGRTLSGALEDFSQASVSLPDSQCKSPGKAENTQRKLDWAIEGEGYFSLLNPLTGEMYYTRQGQFTTNSSGQVVDVHGYRLDPPVTLPPLEKQQTSSDSFLRIDADGTVWAQVDNQEHKLGVITLARADSPKQLSSVGFSRTSVLKSAGGLEQAEPGVNGLGTIKQGALESCGQDIISMPADFLPSITTSGL